MSQRSRPVLKRSKIRRHNVWIVLIRLPLCNLVRDGGARVVGGWPSGGWPTPTFLDMVFQELTIWLWLTAIAMERSTICKNGKPSSSCISIRAIYTMAMLNNQRVFMVVYLRYSWYMLVHASFKPWFFRPVHAMFVDQSTEAMITPWNFGKIMVTPLVSP